MIEHVLDGSRFLFFLWGFLLFMTMVYYGVLDVMLAKQCSHTHVAPEFRLWAASTFVGLFIYLAATAEEELLGEGPGLASLFVAVYLILSSAATWNGASRVKHHRVSIKRGDCN